MVFMKYAHMQICKYPTNFTDKRLPARWWLLTYLLTSTKWCKNDVTQPAAMFVSEELLANRWFQRLRLF